MMNRLIVTDVRRTSAGLALTRGGFEEYCVYLRTGEALTAVRARGTTLSGCKARNTSGAVRMPYQRAHAPVMQSADGFFAVALGEVN